MRMRCFTYELQLATKFFKNVRFYTLGTSHVTNKVQVSSFVLCTRLSVCVFVCTIHRKCDVTLVSPCVLRRKPRTAGAIVTKLIAPLTHVGKERYWRWEFAEVVELLLRVFRLDRIQRAQTPDRLVVEVAQLLHTSIQQRNIGRGLHTYR